MIILEILLFIILFVFLVLIIFMFILRRIIYNFNNRITSLFKRTPYTKNKYSENKNTVNYYYRKKISISKDEGEYIDYEIVKDDENNS